jgi:hypothetical protein
MPTSTLRRAISALFILILVPFTITYNSVYSAPSNPQTISIGEARNLPLGTVVTIDGSITVPSGAFSSSTFDQGFAIQDRTGGIYVSVPDNLGFELRQQVRVTGTRRYRLAGTTRAG